MDVAAKSCRRHFNTVLIETEFWGQMPSPNLMVELSADGCRRFAGRAVLSCRRECSAIRIICECPRGCRTMCGAARNSWAARAAWHRILRSPRSLPCPPMAERQYETNVSRRKNHWRQGLAGADFGLKAPLSVCRDMRNQSHKWLLEIQPLGVVACLLAGILLAPSTLAATSPSAAARAGREFRRRLCNPHLYLLPEYGRKCLLVTPRQLPCSKNVEQKRSEDCPEHCEFNFRCTAARRPGAWACSSVKPMPTRFENRNW